MFYIIYELIMQNPFAYGNTDLIKTRATPATCNVQLGGCYL